MRILDIKSIWLFKIRFLDEKDPLHKKGFRYYLDNEGFSIFKRDLKLYYKGTEEEAKKEAERRAILFQKRFKYKIQRLEYIRVKPEKDIYSKKILKHLNNLI